MQMKSEDEGMGDRGQSRDRFSYVCDVRLKLINDPANIVLIEPSVMPLNCLGVVDIEGICISDTCGSGPLHMHGRYESKLGVSGPSV